MPVTARRKTFAPLDEVPSATLNGMQDDTIAVSADVGAPADLHTTDKSNTVAAINELEARATTDEADFQTHRLANPIDHPDRSIGAIKLHTQVVGAAFGEGVDMDLKAVDDEVVTARGTQPKLDNRLDVILMESGGFRPYMAVPTRGCVVDVSADGRTITVGPGAFLANDGYWYLNTGPVTVAVPGGMTPGTQYYLYLTGNGTAGGAWTATLSTTPPDALGFHPADPAKRYRATFTAGTTTTFLPLRKAGARVTFTAPRGGTFQTPSQSNLSLYLATPPTNTIAETVTDVFSRVPSTAALVYLSVLLASASGGATCALDSVETVVGFGASGHVTLPARFVAAQLAFGVVAAAEAGLEVGIVLLGYEDTW